MTNAQIKKRAQELFTKAMGFSVPLAKIRLLEADMTGDYIFFAVGKVSYTWLRSSKDVLIIYPTTEERNGMVLHMNER
jgi:hypothetical protein